MNAPVDDAEIRRSLASARRLEASDADVDAVLSRLAGEAPRAQRWMPSQLQAWLIALVLVAGLIAAVPPVRAAIGDVASGFAGYFGGDETSRETPGRPVTQADTPPAWLTQDQRTGQRLLAANGGYELYVVREPSGGFGFALDNGVGISDSAAGWERQFRNNAAVVLGPGTKVDPAGQVPLFGVSSGEAVRVEVRYQDGAPSQADSASGGFVVLAEPERIPVDLVALDANGDELQAIDLAYIGWSDFDSD